MKIYYFMFSSILLHADIGLLCYNHQVVNLDLNYFKKKFLSSLSIFAIFITFPMPILNHTTVLDNFTNSIKKS